LKQAGFTPVTFDNLVTGWKDAVKFGPFEPGDLLNKADVDRAFKKHAPVAVMHFATLSQVGESMLESGLYWQNNVMGSLEPDPSYSQTWLPRFRVFIYLCHLR
jgi:UDP-glucose 4-epimerase